MKNENKLQLFQNQKIRSHWDEKLEIWFFSIVDIVEILTEQKDYQGARNYWKVLKHRLLKEGNETVTNCNRLKMLSADGKMRLTDVANTKDIFRLIQSIPSKKAEPFKQWLAQVGKERLDEIENPELAQERMKAIYEQKGYPKDWIDKRLRGIAIRQNLTDEWQERGIKKHSDYAILTAEISKATFGMTPTEYKDFKNLPAKSKANLRDNMDDLELIFTMLGERVTTEISKEEKPETFNENKKVANRGDKVAGNARKETEKELGRSVVSEDIFWV
ncbi:MAG: Bro-N domain-containing protein [Candidatus Thiodubiliella endoseptemdiera]|uniref:Bro-N domain-containing protein n=1 Tax=Candidatus Thiodubiliella endoseptemdiera TaxID=2738886 RepID=A0A853F3Q7_9GAMM|nr:Bro-N domain-containing protein [Candidatus Thiodubiliella endoseptemdiera]